MPRAAAVANEFLELSRQEVSSGPIDQMKLQKLVFYAHAWWLAYKDEGLIPEDIEAWPWGPVVRDIYSQTAKFGRQAVVGSLRVLDENGEWITPKLKDVDQKKHVKSVWDTHKSFSGIQLSNATHMQGEPWTVVNAKYSGDLATKPVIPNELIKNIFHKKVSDK